MKSRHNQGSCEWESSIYELLFVSFWHLQSGTLEIFKKIKRCMVKLNFSLPYIKLMAEQLYESLHYIQNFNKPKQAFNFNT
jgi:hypothetical protein